jgi:hypothetical protein
MNFGMGIQLRGIRQAALRTSLSQKTLHPLLGGEGRGEGVHNEQFHFFIPLPIIPLPKCFFSSLPFSCISWLIHFPFFRPLSVVKSPLFHGLAS